MEVAATSTATAAATASATATQDAPGVGQFQQDATGRWWVWTTQGWQLHSDPVAAGANAIEEAATTAAGVPGATATLGAAAADTHPVEPAAEWQRDATGHWWRWDGTVWVQWSESATPGDSGSHQPAQDPHAVAAAEEYERRGDGVTTEEPRRLRLGDILVEAGVIDEPALRKALSAQYGQGTRRRLGEVLLDMGAVTEEQLMLALSQRLGVDYVDLDSKSIDDSLLQVITPEYCNKLQLVPFEVDAADLSISVALADPTQVVAIDDLTLLTGRRLVPYAALPSAVERALARIRSGDLDAMSNAEDSEVRTVRLIDTLLGEAVRSRASDLHIEPVGAKVLVRARVDGRLRPIFRADIESLPRLVSRLKILADLDISEKRRPQDGRAHFETEDKRVDARVSTLPSVRGEKVVMRLIDRDESAPALGELGMIDASLQLFRDAISETQGLVLITGPTGSGKTTTLYSALSAVLEPEVNVITLEDPVERELLGSTQVHIEEKKGLTFPAALRSVLRQDPDVIMVGEVRDLETAEITLRASLSGHLVFSTVHTNDTCSTVTRLIEMGIEPYLVGSALSVVVAQRLVRRICASCAEPAPVPVEEARRLRVRLPDEGYWRRGAGCPACSHTGYKGRVGVYEVLRIDDAIEELLVPGVTAAEVFKVARAAGLHSMWDEGMRLAAEGVTTLAEIGRVVSGARIPPELLVSPGA
ncbi:MAG: GspE/PulE family protein [Acidimicrobiia bacterium]